MIRAGVSGCRDELDDAVHDARDAHDHHPHADPALGGAPGLFDGLGAVVAVSTAAAVQLRLLGLELLGRHVLE